MLVVGVADIVQVVCNILLDWKYFLRVLIVRHVLVIKMLQVVYNMLTHECGNTCDTLSTRAGPALVYTYYIYSFISIFNIAFFGVHTKLNNHILQCSDIKFTYKIETLQIYWHIIQSLKVLLSNWDWIFNHIWIEITFYDKCTKSKINFLQWCNLKMYS